MTENIKNCAKRWKLVSASVCGVSHEKSGQPCQDAHGWEIIDGNILIAVVADGAGLAIFGQVGADIAVQSSLEKIRTAFSELKDNLAELLIEAVKYARAAVESEASVRNVKPRDLATTLIILVATPETAAAAQVGDGALILEDTEGNLVALTAPQQNSEFINETVFLVSPDCLDIVQIKVMDIPVAHIALFSDGLQMLALKMPEGIPYKPFFTPFFRFVRNMEDEIAAKEQLTLFLRSPKVTERADDDLTLVIGAVM